MDTDDAHFTSKLKHLNSACPSVLNSLIPTLEREHTEDTLATDVLSDPQHLRPAARSRIKADYVKGTLGLPTVANKIPADMRLALYKGYKEHYSKTYAGTGLGNKPLRWYKMLASDNP
jgi:hypothetical protein